MAKFIEIAERIDQGQSCPLIINTDQISSLRIRDNRRPAEYYLNLSVRVDSIRITEKSYYTLIAAFFGKGVDNA